MASLTSPLAGGLSPPRSLPSPPFFSGEESRSEIAGCSRADSESEVDEWSDLGRWIFPASSLEKMFGRDLYRSLVKIIIIVVGSNLL